MIQKRALVGKRKVADFLENHRWTERKDLVAIYDEMMPQMFEGDILQNEVGEIAWLTSTKSTMAVFKTEQDLRDNFDLILRNWDK